MTALHPFRVADAAATTKLDPTTLEALVKGTLFVIGTSDTLGNITQASGQIALAVAWAKTGLIYYYDSTDTTTADDATTCLVDASGHRYKLEDSASIKVSSVLALQNDPPVSPAVGDAYVVDTVPTGAWVGYANDIAIYTRRGWVFAVPEIGTTVLNQATNLNIQFNDSSAWAAFASTNTDSSIRPRALEWPMGLAVEATQNSPPGSPAVGLYYIVGSVPTGAWSGQSGKVATYYNSAWEFMSPYEGASVFNRALGYELYYVSGAWSGVAASNVQQFDTAGSATWTKPSIGTMAHIEIWGAGASGAHGSSTAGGGGGGAFCEMWIPLSSLGSTESVTVGAGGASVTSGNTAGNVGGNSSFGSWLTAYGGGAPSGSGSTTAAGGGGGGVEGAGSAAVTSTGGNGGLGDGGQAGGAGGTSGNAGASSSVDGGGGGGGVNGNGGSSGDGGGGGGGQGNQTGGKSRRGGGGGGGHAGGAGGASIMGGNGGAGGGAGNGVAGTQPGGGGGGAAAGNSGKGGDGRVRVSVF